MYSVESHRVTSRIAFNRRLLYQTARLRITSVMGPGLGVRAHKLVSYECPATDPSISRVFGNNAWWSRYRETYFRDNGSVDSFIWNYDAIGPRPAKPKTRRLLVAAL
jgi:hypothetical protein